MTSLVRPPTLQEIDAAWLKFAALAKQDPIFWRALVLKLEARFAELARLKTLTTPPTKESR